MKRSLGDTGEGYYTQKVRIGFSGADFFTAPEISPAFASLLALQIQEIDRSLGYPDPFYLIEAGPGNGTLAESLLSIFMTADKNLFKRLSPIYFELPGILEEEQRKRISRFPLTHPPQWIHENGSRKGREETLGGAGLVFGNEFLDALPVHHVRVSSAEWQEAYVETGVDGSYSLVWGAPSGPEILRHLSALFPLKELSKLEGRETEICLETPATLDLLDGYLACGFMLWIDYGDIGCERHSERRKRGTLMAYKDQKATERLVGTGFGESDMTAHVDFSQVAQHLRSIGYRLEGYTDQMSWLMGLGFPEWMAANQDRLSPREIDCAGVLIHPLKMGRIFKVLGMSKGLKEPAGLSGFRYGGLRSPLEG